MRIPSEASFGNPPLVQQFHFKLSEIPCGNLPGVFFEIFEALWKSSGRFFLEIIQSEKFFFFFLITLHDFLLEILQDVLEILQKFLLRILHEFCLGILQAFFLGFFQEFFTGIINLVVSSGDPVASVNLQEFLLRIHQKFLLGIPQKFLLGIPQDGLFL